MILKSKNVTVWTPSKVSSPLNRVPTPHAPTLHSNTRHQAPSDAQVTHLDDTHEHRGRANKIDIADHIVKVLASNISSQNLLVSAPSDPGPQKSSFSHQ